MKETLNKKSLNNPEKKSLTEAKRKELYSIREKYFNHLKMSENNNQTIEDLQKLYPPTNQQKELLKQVDDLKKCLDSLRPFHKFQLKNLEEYYESFYTYESNRIEGNSLTHNETYLVIREGLTIAGKPLKDHLEAVNHKDAYWYIKDLAKKKIELNERELLNIHSLILRSIDNDNAGRYRNVRVGIRGSDYVFPEPYIVPKQMEDFFIWYEENKETLHPVLLAGEMHQRLVTIHPFIDGNGRTSRLIMNLILFQHGFPLVNISGERKERQEYYNVLEHYHLKSDNKPFLTFILKQQKKSLFDYIAMFSSNMDLKDKGYYFFQKVNALLK